MDFIASMASGGLDDWAAPGSIGGLAMMALVSFAARGG